MYGSKGEPLFGFLLSTGGADMSMNPSPVSSATPQTVMRQNLEKICSILHEDFRTGLRLELKITKLFD